MYEQFYGLKSAPFRLSPDPAFFFGSQGHKRALAYLRYGLNQKEGFIVITGAPGTGKTTLARSLLQEIGRDKIVVAELNTTHLEADDVLRMVAASFGLEHEGLPKATLLKRLESFFISRARAGYHVLLLVDEAQNLPYGSLEELRMLSNFYIGKDALIQIFLLGQEQFRNSLYTSELEQLRQRVVASSHLEPLNQDETREYIEHRLTLSGWKGNPQISDRAFVRLFALTKGVPRRINTFCERLMLYGALEELTELHDANIKAVAKELMYEVSAKGVKLSDINPGEPGKIITEGQTGANTDDENTEKATREAVEAIDSEMLSSFSDEITEPDSEKPKTTTVSHTEHVADSQAASVDEEDSVFDDSTDIEESIETHYSEPPSSPASKNTKPSKLKEGESQTLRVVASGRGVERQLQASPQTESPMTDTKPDWWELVALAVAYYREPAKFKSITSSKSVIPPGISECFKLAIGKALVPDYLRSAELSNVSDQVIRDALRYYIKNVLLSNTADYYRRLGVTSNASFEQIRSNYKYLFRLFQPDKEQNASNWDETFTRRINQAYGTLRSTEKRNEYDEFLSALKSRNNKSTVDSGDDGVALPEPEKALVVESKKIIIDESSEDFTEQDYVENDSVTYASRKNSRVLGLLFGALLIMAGGAAYYVIQPDLTALFGGGRSLDSTSTELPQSVKQLAVLDKQLPQKEIDVPLILERTELPVKEESMLASDNADIDITEVSSKRDKVAEADLIDSNLKSTFTKPVEAVETAAPATRKPRAVVVETESTKPVKETVSAPVKTKNNAVKSPDPVPTKIIAADRKVKSVVKIDVPEVKVIAPVVVASIPAKTNVIQESLNTVKEVAAEKISSTKPKSITQKDLSDFLTGFSLAYEEGNLDAFMTFFTEDSSTNDARNKLAIRKDYETLFSTTEMRVIDLENLNWKIKDQRAVGKGGFTITVLGRGGSNMKNFSGLIKLEVVSIQDHIKLKGMYHAYGAKE